MSSPESSSELTVITHSDGYLLLGPQADVDALVEQNQLRSLTPAPGLIAGIASVLEFGSAVWGQHGRWLKLDEKSAALLKQYGEATSSTTGLMTGVVRNAKGQVMGHLQFVGKAGALNPATAAAASVLLNQIAHQQQMEEMHDYLKQISADVRQLKDDQLHRAMADITGIALIVEEVESTLESTGHVDEVSWSKLHGAAVTIASTQAYAIKKLEEAARDLQKAKGSAELSDDERAIEQVREAGSAWLNLLGHSMYLQDAVATVEIERVKNSGMNELESYVSGLEAAREHRADRIQRALDAILGVANEVALAAQAKRLTKPRKVAAITAANNAIHHQIEQFSRAAGVESSAFTELENPKYRQFAAGRLKEAAAATASKSKALVESAAELPGKVSEARDERLLKKAEGILAKRKL